MSPSRTDALTVWTKPRIRTWTKVIDLKGGRVIPGLNDYAYVMQKQVAPASDVYKSLFYWGF
jgi:hypothetical protein